MVFAQDAKEAAVEYPEVEKFVGRWHGELKRVKNPQSSYPIILEIKHRQGRAVQVTMESRRFGNPRTSGMGITTPRSVSWVELNLIDGGRVYLFGRYLANLTDDNRLNGKYFEEGSLDETASFALQKVNSQEVNGFNDTNARILKRLKVANDEAGFLHPVYAKLLPSAISWLNSTLGKDFKIIDQEVIPDIDYADNLARALEQKENLFARSATTAIPLRLPKSIYDSINIKNYSITFPVGFPKDGKSYPLRIDLHGGGGRGAKLHYTRVDDSEEDRFIVLNPICESTWQPNSLNALFTELKRILPIDEERVYLHGASMGGAGTYGWAMANPEHFAAIAVLCGKGRAFSAPVLKNTPVWIFHGQQDNIVPFYHAQMMLTALEECGGHVKHTFFPEGNHTSIFGLIDQNALYDWFLTHKRSKKTNPRDPIEDLRINADGIGRKIILTIPRGNYAAIQSIRNRDLYSPLYKVFQQAGVRTSQLIEDRIHPSLPDRMINLVLSLPQDLHPQELPDGVRIVELPASRSLRFAAVADGRGSLDGFIESAIEELKRSGETPTGEIRKMLLSGSYGANTGITRVDIILE